MDWIWTQEQVDPKRLKSAKKVVLSNVVMNQSDGTASAQCIRSAAEPYNITLTSCTCSSFCITSKGNFPCKHILSLAMHVHLINRKGLTEIQQAEKDALKMRLRLEHAFASYYLFGESVLSDAAYDKLKSKVAGVIVPEASECNAQEKHNKPLGKEAVIYNAIRSYLIEHGFEYVDKTDKGGALYFFDKVASKELQDAGYTVCYAPNGSHSTKLRPAWYVKEKT